MRFLALLFSRHLFAPSYFLKSLALIHQKKEGGSPTRSLLGDRPLMADIALWGISVIVILYR